MRRRTAVIGVSVTCGLALAATTAALMFDLLMIDAGRSDLSQFGLDAVPFIAALASAVTVGAVLAIRRPEHPVGWLFLALGVSVTLAGLLDGYGAYGAIVRADPLPAADLAVVVGDSLFIPWFALVALILHLTPTGQPLSMRWGRIAAATVVAGSVWFAVRLVSPDVTQPPLDSIANPLAVLPGSLDGPLRAVRWVASVLTSVGLVAAGVSLLVRFRRSTGTERRRLLWLAIVVVPLPAFVALSFVAARSNHEFVLGLATGGFIALIPVAAGLSIAKYHLYDVDQILSRAVTYLLVSCILAVTYIAVVVATGRLIGDRGGSTLPAVLGTLAAVAAAAPAYRSLQGAVDQRFNRRRYDAVRMVREYVRAPTTQSIQDVLRAALAIRDLRVAYWVSGREQWVTEDGRQVVTEPDEIEIRRHGEPIARIAYDHGAIEPAIAEAATAEATPELVSAGLRAAISLQLAEVRESRRRIAAAQLAERRRIERDLHDGAQQRLLALALQMQAAQVNGSAERLREAAATGVTELQAAVVELRELANGLHPAVLSDSGLGAALDDLASRLPLRVEVRAGAGRFPPQIESTAWFIACEAISNAVKHADAAEIEVSVGAMNGTLTLTVSDDGRGDADPWGAGLRGIADRAEAVGGAVTVRTRPGGGTLVIGKLPCGS
jgi:signal transduction histidine kinase